MKNPAGLSGKKREIDEVTRTMPNNKKSKRKTKLLVREKRESKRKRTICRRLPRERECVPRRKGKTFKNWVASDAQKESHLGRGVP